MYMVLHYFRNCRSFLAWVTLIRFPLKYWTSFMKLLKILRMKPMPVVSPWCSLLHETLETETDAARVELEVVDLMENTVEILDDETDVAKVVSEVAHLMENTVGKYRWSSWGWTWCCQSCSPWVAHLMEDIADAEWPISWKTQLEILRMKLMKPKLNLK